MRMIGILIGGVAFGRGLALGRCLVLTIVLVAALRPSGFCHSLPFLTNFL